MSQLYARSRNGPRRGLLVEARARTTRSRMHIENTISDSEPETTATYQKPRARLSRSGASRTAQSDDEGSNDVSDEDGEPGDEESDEEADDSDEPEVFAPSRSDRVSEAGPFTTPITSFAKLDAQEEMFALDHESDTEAPGTFSYAHFDEDAQVEEDEEYGNAFVIGEDEKAEAENDYDHYLNTIDGMSAYGFGDNDLRTIPSSSSEELDDLSSPVLRRHVRFVPDTTFAAPEATPTVAPALLPSALPDMDAGVTTTTIQSDLQQLSAIQQINAANNSLGQDPYDSDATVESLPPEAHTTNLSTLKQDSSVPSDDSTALPAESKKAKRSKRRKGPPRGFFEFDDNKPYALTNAEGQLEFFVPASGPNRPEWLSKDLLPSDSEDGDDNVSLSKLVEESGSEASVSLDRNLNDLEPLAPLQTTNTIDSGSLSQRSAPGGHDVFDRAGTFQLDDYLVDDADLTDAEEGLYGDVIDAFISFGDDSSDNELQDSSGFENLDQAQGRGTDNRLSQLNPANVSSFRRRADPARAATGFDTEAVFVPRLQIPPTAFMDTPRQGHKRKASSPYSSPVYKGVTPVQRVLRKSKRRKITS